MTNTSDKHPAPPRLHFSLAPEPSRLLRARERIRDYLALYCSDATTVNDVVLAVEEACTNAIRHSGSDKAIEIRLSLRDHMLRAAVKDRGSGFDVATFDPQRLPEPMCDHGRGLFLISRLCDRLRLRSAGGLTVEMSKRVERRGQASDGAVATASQASYWQGRQQSLFEEMAESFATLDWEYRIAYLNATAFAFFGLRPEGTLGHSFWEIFAATRTMAVGAAVRRAMELGISGIEEYVSPRLGRWVETRVYPTGSGVSIYLRDIDERKRKEIERDELEQRFRALFEHSPEAIFLTDGEGATLAANQAACEMLGYTEQELCTLSRGGLLDQADPRLASALAERARTGQVKGVELTAIRSDGEHIPVEVDSTILPGEPPWAFVVERDISERKQAEDALRESEERFRAVLESSADVLYRVDLDTRRYDYISPSVERVVGFSAQELMALDPESSQTMVHPEDRDLLDDAIHACERAGQAEVDYRQRDKQGDYRWLSNSMTLVRDDAGGPLYRAGTIRDVTERKRAEEALRASEERERYLADVVETASVPFAVRRPDGALVLFNQAFADLVGYARSELEEGAETLAVSITPPDWWQVEAPLLAAAVAQRQPVRYEKEYVRKDGSRVPVEVFAQPVLNETGELVHYRSFLTDITERKHAEEALASSRAELAATLNAIPDGFYTLDRDWRVTYLNDKAAAIFPGGIKALGASFFELFPEAAGTDFETYKRRAMEQGKVCSYESYYPPFETWFEERDYPRADGITVLFIDITARKQAELEREEATRLSEALNAIDAVVHSSLRADETIQTALREGAQAIGAEQAGVSLHEDEAHRFRVGYVHNHPPDTVGMLIPDSEEIHGLAAMRTGKTLPIDDAQTDPRVVGSLMDAWQIRSVICAPLIVQGKPIGVVYYSYRSAPHHFTDAEIDFMTHLAASLSTAVENATLYEAQRDIAMALQRAIMHPLPDVAGLEFGVVGLSASAPALVGGDIWDVFELPDDKLLILTGDVAGKGVRAAALAEAVHNTMRAFALVDNNPAFILRKTNDLLLADTSVETFVTALAVVLDKRSGVARIASAGHPGPVCVGAGACELIEPTYGPPLGSFAAEYPTTSVQLGRGQALVLYTDGVTEARRDGSLFGERQALEVVGALADSSAQEIADGLAGAAASFGGELKDDLEVLVARWI